VRVFVAGGSGVMGRRLVPLLVADGHVVTAMTRTAAKLDLLRELGATPVLCDAYDADALAAAVGEAAPDVVIHQLTDLPDDPAQVATGRAANARIREAGTDNLVAAARAAGPARLVTQSIAWLTDGARPPSVEHLEVRTIEAGGVVVRYGQWYGPGTYHPRTAPPPPRIHIDAAARLTIAALDVAGGTYVATDDGLVEAAAG
jgi:nucleoside-diphosphate-sugar epimerase